jgi:hypothetical protein
MISNRIEIELQDVVSPMEFSSYNNPAAARLNFGQKAVDGFLDIIQSENIFSGTGYKTFFQPVNISPQGIQVPASDKRINVHDTASQNCFLFFNEFPWLHCIKK